MTEHAILAGSAASPSAPGAVAVSASGQCAVLTDGDRAEIIDGPVLHASAPIVAAAVFDDAIWLVTAAGGTHQLERFGLDGAALGSHPLGELGDRVAISAQRSGPRHALIQGHSAVAVREVAGSLTIEALARAADRRVLVGARGIGERTGQVIVVRPGAVPALAIPSDLASATIRSGTIVLDGAALLVEVCGRTGAFALIYDLRRGSIQSRVRLGDARVLAVAERSGHVVLGRASHVALLDLRAGHCVGERILGADAVGGAIDSSGDRLLLIDAQGKVSTLGRSMRDLGATDEPARAELVTDVAPEEAPTQIVGEPAPQPPPVREEQVAIPDVMLHGLGPARGARIAPAELAAYLDGARRWIETMADTAIALAANAPEAVATARASERGARDRFAVWNRPGAPHVEIARELQLSPLATTILMLVAAPQIWGELARRYGSCTADPARPLIDELLLAHLLEADAVMRADVAAELDPASRLVRTGAITLGPGLRPYAALSVHRALVRRLTGGRADDARTAPALADVIGPRAAIAALVRSLAERRSVPVRVVVRGRRGSGRRTIAAALAGRLGRSIELVEVVDDVEVVHQRLRDLALAGVVPCLSLDALSDDVALRNRLRAMLEAHAGPVIFRAPDGGELPLAPGFDELVLPALSQTERRGAWHRFLDQHALDTGVAASVAARFPVGAGAIARACTAAARSPHADLEQSLRAALLQERSARIAGVAERIERLAAWEQLVVPGDVDEAMRELVGRIRHRGTVLEAWGMEHVAPTARGVTALLEGGPGTGKTMAAGVIARALGYELWRVDLSKIASKWHGETEKNLAAVFEAAEEGEIVLLFDEADSLFTRRTDVKSSNDKHANAATNYLLQRLDSFTGIAILTTNFGTAIDPAFKRRLAVMIQFPFPDEDERLRLWRAHLPSALPTAGDLELAALARTYQLSGGYIRNATLRAAYLAAERNASITADLLRRAVTLEYERAGKLGNGRLE